MTSGRPSVNVSDTDSTSYAQSFGVSFANFSTSTPSFYFGTYDPATGSPYGKYNHLMMFSELSYTPAALVVENPTITPPSLKVIESPKLAATYYLKNLVVADVPQSSQTTTPTTTANSSTSNTVPKAKTPHNSKVTTTSTAKTKQPPKATVLSTSSKRSSLPKHEPKAVSSNLSKTGEQSNFVTFVLGTIALLAAAGLTLFSLLAKRKSRPE